MPELTPRQSEVLTYIRDRIADGLPPTVREIGRELGIRSPNGVRCHLEALERKGLIRRDAYKSRAIWLAETERESNVTTD